jgi:FtsP/CotA-like multicopper oxidase with cupredoxin domain
MSRSKQRLALAFVFFVGVLVAALGGSIGSRAEAAPGESTIVCTNGPEFDLKAASGYISTPDGNSVFMWSYAPAAGDFQLPGPVLCVHEGDLVTVHLSNELGEPVSIVFPGQEGVEADGSPVQPQFSGGTLTSLAQTAAPGGAVTYTFTAGEPGTYLYESGTEADKQVQMGLYGALIVRPALGSNYAYDDASTIFNPDEEYLILMHEIDPNLHSAVEHGKPFHNAKFVDRYWTVNGRSFPDSIADNFASWLPSQPYGSLVRVEAQDPSAPGAPALVRMLNAGSVNHPFHPHANHIRAIARDGRLFKGPAGENTSMEAFTKTLGSGETADILFSWRDVDAWRPESDLSANPVPVTMPGLQNLVFKDDLTFYSGSPYLGYTDDLPVGTTSYNECGEFFFPWHSHALNEFQNFDEGFGGLATLVRVDPPGGCPAP